MVGLALALDHLRDGIDRKLTDVERSAAEAGTGVSAALVLPQVRSLQGEFDAIAKGLVRIPALSPGPLPCFSLIPIS